MFAASVLAFLGGGWLLDLWLGTFPVLMLLGALGGAGLATLSIYRTLIGGERPTDDSHGARP
jgi:F0F1-type ATP synthase assembly protein I